MVIKSKLRLTVDIGPLFETQWTGIPVFTRRAVQSLLASNLVDLDFAYNLVNIPREQVIDAIKCNSGGFLRDSYERHVGKKHRFKLVDTKRPIFYPTVKLHHGVLARESSTVHDMSTLVMPENHETANIDYHMEYLQQELVTDEVVFCVSEATEAALLSAYPSVKSKTRVLYQYADWPENFLDIDKNLPSPMIGPYVAVIGTIEPRKNLSLILAALKEPALQNSDIKFVVIGKKGWKVDEFLAELTTKERSRIIFSGFVTEFIKYRLLRHCEFLVFPSVYEGFGIPALEAMTLGKPVVAAMTSSFPEVIGPAGIYFDPCSTSDFSEAFSRAMNLKIRARHAEQAIPFSSSFNQKRMSEEIIRWLRQQ